MSSDPPNPPASGSLDAPVDTVMESSTPSSGENALPADIRQQVEQEQALADAQKRLKELEADNERLQREKKEVEEARDGSGELVGLDQMATADRVVTTNNQLRTQLSQLQSTYHGSSAELSVIQLRIDVSFLAQGA
jgi:small-conductance mechanosensitive channel